MRRKPLLIVTVINFLVISSITLFLAPPFLKELRISGIHGCGQSPSSKFMIQKDVISIIKLYEDFLKRDKKGLLTTEDRHDLVKDLWDTKTEDRS